MILLDFYYAIFSMETCNGEDYLLDSKKSIHDKARVCLEGREIIERLQ